MRLVDIAQMITYMRVREVSNRAGNHDVLLGLNERTTISIMLQKDRCSMLNVDLPIAARQLRFSLWRCRNGFGLCVASVVV